MLSIIFSITIFGFFSSFFNASAPFEQKNILTSINCLQTKTIENIGHSSITIKITGINELKGVIRVGLFNNEFDFPKAGNEYRIEDVDVNSNEVVCTFNNLPEGNYAIALYQDINDDRNCNLNLLGIPKEPYGFSNNVKPFLRSPSFDDAKFSLDENYELIISLI